MKKSTGDRFRELRGRKSLAEFAKALGVTGQQISRIENDLSKPSIELAEKVCEVYNVTLDWLIRGMETPEDSGNSKGDMVSIPVKEYIELQRYALEKEREEKETLKKQLDELKNI